MGSLRSQRRSGRAAVRAPSKALGLPPPSYNSGGLRLVPCPYKSRVRVCAVSFLSVFMQAPYSNLFVVVGHSLVRVGMGGST